MSFAFCDAAAAAAAAADFVGDDDVDGGRCCLSHELSEISWILSWAAFYWFVE